MALKKRKDITLGSGKLYVQEYTGTTVPETEAICTDDNILGYISGGATLSYKPTFYNAKDDLGLVSKTVLTAEEVTLKSGVMTWDGNTLTKLSATARVTETDAASGKPAKRSVKIGGVANADGKKYVLCFKHADKDGKLNEAEMAQLNADASKALEARRSARREARKAARGNNDMPLPPAPVQEEGDDE